MDKNIDAALREKAREFLVKHAHGCLTAYMADGESCPECIEKVRALLAAERAEAVAEITGAAHAGSDHASAKTAAAVRSSSESPAPRESGALLPCPFCGVEPKACKNPGGSKGVWHPWIDDCRLSNLTFSIAAWNRRTPSPAVTNAWSAR